MGTAAVARPESESKVAEQWRFTTEGLFLESFLRASGIAQPTFGEVCRNSTRALCLSTCRKLYAATSDEIERETAMRALARVDAYADLAQRAGRFVRRALAAVFRVGLYRAR